MSLATIKIDWFIKSPAEVFISQEKGNKQDHQLPVSTAESKKDSAQVVRTVQRIVKPWLFWLSWKESQQHQHAHIRTQTHPQIQPVTAEDN